MPPRYVYWTIIAGGLPTAFRAVQRDELLPTFNRIREKHPDAEMKWFARGKLWSSPEESRAPRISRPRDWRPGGEHRDPRQAFKDAKKAQNQDRRRQRWEGKQSRDGKPRPPQERPQGDALRKEVRGGKRAFTRAAPRPGRRPAPRADRRPAPRSDRRPSGRRFEKERPLRARGIEEPASPPLPAGPDHEPRRSQESAPEPQPRPSEPGIAPPGPPERGHDSGPRPRASGLQSRSKA